MLLFFFHDLINLALYDYLVFEGDFHPNALIYLLSPRDDIGCVSSNKEI